MTNGNYIPPDSPQAISTREACRAPVESTRHDLARGVAIHKAIERTGHFSPVASCKAPDSVPILVPPDSWARMVGRCERKGQPSAVIVEYARNVYGSGITIDDAARMLDEWKKAQP